MAGAGQPTTYRVAATVISIKTEMREGERWREICIFVNDGDGGKERVHSHMCARGVLSRVNESVTHKHHMTIPSENMRGCSPLVRWPLFTLRHVTLTVVHVSPPPFPTMQMKDFNWSNCLILKFLSLTNSYSTELILKCDNVVANWSKSWHTLHR